MAENKEELVQRAKLAEQVSKKDLIENHFLRK